MKVQTVDENEMKFFDRYSSTWWDRNGPIMSLHLANDLMVKYMKNVISTCDLPQNQIQVLDVGCGGGLVSEPLARCGFRVTGIDVNENMIKVAKQHASLDPSLSSLNYEHQSVEEHVLENAEKYDVIVLNFVLQHVKNHEILLNSCVKALKPGGLFFMTSAAKTFMSWIQVIVLGEMIYRYIARNGHNWDHFISAKEVEDILIKNNCMVKETIGLYYSKLWKKWYWHNGINNGFYSMFAIKC